MNEILATLNERVQKRYVKLFADLNKNVMVMPALDGDKPGTFAYMVPSVVLTGNGADPLLPPSTISVSSTKTQGIIPVYRTLIPTFELEIAAKNDSYFNYLMDEILDKCLRQYAQKYGAYDALRFGEYYAKVDPLVEANTDNANFIELRITGKYAGK
jgi:hypothetical protein